MNLEEIKKKFKDEWVLIEYTKLDENLAVLEGEVLAHSSDRDTIYKEQLRYKDKQLSIEYLGDAPEDWAVML
jgi:hypothetical protein